MKNENKNINPCSFNRNIRSGNCSIAVDHKKGECHTVGWSFRNLINAGTECNRVVRFSLLNKCRIVLLVGIKPLFEV